MSDHSYRKDVLGKSITTIWNELTSDDPAETHVVSVELAVSDISPNPEQPRKFFDHDAMEELKKSVRQEGVLQPILVRKNSDPDGTPYQIIAGERRWRASVEVDLATIPAIILECDASTALQLGLIENLQRDELSPIDEARSLQMLMEKYKKSTEDVAKILSKSVSFVRNSLRLLKLPEPVQDLLTQHQISPGHARAIVESEDPLALAKRIVQDGLTVRDAEKLMKSEKRPFRTPKSQITLPEDPENSADAAMFEELLTEFFHAPTRIRLRDGGGQIQILFRDAQQLEDIFDRLSMLPPRN